MDFNQFLMIGCYRSSDCVSIGIGPMIGLIDDLMSMSKIIQNPHKGHNISFHLLSSI